MTTKYKICVVTPVYAFGGVPFAQLRFARALAAQGHDVDFIIGQVYPDYPLPEINDVNVIELNSPKARGMVLPLKRYFKSDQPDIVFSAEDHLNGIVLLAAILSGSKAKISGSSRVPPSDTYSNKVFSKGWLFKQMLKMVMWRADALTCVSSDMVEHYKEYFKPAPHVCVHNIVGDKHSRSRMNEPVDNAWFHNQDCPLIVAAGTLTKRKGFEDLIRAMKILSSRKKAKLVILGEGYLRSKHEALIAELELGEIVSLPGFVENPLKYFALSDIFVLSSYAEGLPNALVEGMMAGCTPVSTDCPTGPREVLQDGKYGYLVPLKDPQALAGALEKAIDSPIPKELLDQAIVSFSEHEVIKKHFEVLKIDHA